MRRQRVVLGEREVVVDVGDHGVAAQHLRLGLGAAEAERHVLVLLWSRSNG